MLFGLFRKTSGTIFSNTIRLRKSILAFSRPPGAIQSMSRRSANHLEELRSIPKWGFIIYRCDYRDDDAWKAFMDGWSDRVNQWLLHKNAGHLIQTLDFT